MYLTRLRRFYGMIQQELAALLGITPALVSYLESGQRALSQEVSRRIVPFLAAMEAVKVIPNVDTPPAGPVEPGPLERRRAACLHEAHNLRWQLRALPEQAAVAARWALTLPVLRAALPPPPPQDKAPTTFEGVRLRHVQAWLDTVPLALSPEELAQWHLRHLRALALETEAAALSALLGQVPQPPAF